MLMRLFYCSCLMALGLPYFAQALTINIVTNKPGVDNSAFQLVSSSPYEKQLVSSSPEKVVLTFSRPFKPDKSYIRVMDMYGGRREVGDMVQDGLSLSVDVPGLSPGRYTVKWKARCNCDDDIEISDSFRFTVQ